MGVALFDFKNDGKLDILLGKGRRWPPAIKVPCQTNSVWRALHRNDLVCWLSLRRNSPV
jgi:hypothetical protein